MVGVVDSYGETALKLVSDTIRGWDAKTITDFEVSADIVVRKSVMDGKNPLGFEAAALSDLLINQVSPPE